ncbi:MAG: GTP-binding protein [Firmicutes bacterium HGW-Firmicutes-11]|jgi:G3E family GTPase|nr:MAG: GTP-binding protein [Firmicutes bacterium HGW-Firmicutes-11]
MIDLILITGFLGTGKTTLLQELLNEYKNQRIGIIVNEFGEIGIDGALVERDGVRMNELSNGSIFCACIKDKFIESLIAMAKEPISMLFIEASGLADPANFPQILTSIQNRTEGQYRFRGSICVLDGETFLDYYDLLPALHQQAAYSNNIIVNKIDLITESTLESIVETIEAANSNASVAMTSYCRLDYDALVKSMKPADLPGEETTNTIESRPKSFVLHGKEAIPHAELSGFLEALSMDAYRIKGFARTTEGNFYISGVRGRVEFAPWKDEILDTRIVIISAIGIRMMSRILNERKGELVQLLSL